MPKISIITAVYNIEPYLKRSMDDLINKSFNRLLKYICGYIELRGIKCFSVQ